MSRCLLTFFVLITLASWPSAPIPCGFADAALSVLPHQSDAIVMQLRSTILVDEKDLVGPQLPTACSSLDDGPFCDPFGGQDDHSFGASSPSIPELLTGDRSSGSSMFVVDGILSNRIQSRNKEALEWNAETYRTFSTLVSRVISESIGSVSQDLSSRPFGSGSAAKNSAEPARARASPSGSKCFRLAFNHLSPDQRYIPSNFSAGLPVALAASWEGLWEPEAAADGARRGAKTDGGDVAAGWRTRVVLRTALGYIRFARPVVVRRFTIGVPEAAVGGGVSAKPWGRNGLICGRLQGKEQWCAHLEEFAPTAVTADVADSPSEEALRLVDVSYSIVAVDEIAILSAPVDGLRVALVEVGATPTEHAVLEEFPAQRRVVMLRRSQNKRGYEAAGAKPSAILEPVLATVSRDAAMWDLNEMLRHNMQLRLPSTAALVGFRGSLATETNSESAQLPLSRGAAVAGSPGTAAAQQPSTPPSMLSLQGMLRGLKANVLKPPPGVTYSRLKKEISALVASTSEIQDEDVLVHSRIETLLQQRLRERCLDGLQVLQAAWQDLIAEWRAGLVFGPNAERLAELMEQEKGMSQSGSDTSQRHTGARPGASSSSRVEMTEQASSVDEAEKKKADYQTAYENDRGVETAEDHKEHEADESKDELFDDVANAMKRASAELQQKSSEAKRLRKVGPDQFEFELNLDEGTVELRMQKGSTSIPDIMAKAMANAMADGEGVTWVSGMGDLTEAEATDVDGLTRKLNEVLKERIHLDDAGETQADPGILGEILKTLAASQHDKSDAGGEAGDEGESVEL